VLAADVSVIGPLPLPDAGDTVSAVLLVDAVHVDGEHPAGAAVSVTACDPPLDGNDMAVGDTVNVHASVTPMVCFPDSPE